MTTCHAVAEASLRSLCSDAQISSVHQFLIFGGRPGPLFAGGRSGTLFFGGRPGPFRAGERLGPVFVESATFKGELPGSTFFDGGRPGPRRDGNSVFSRGTISFRVGGRPRRDGNSVIDRGTASFRVGGRPRPLLGDGAGLALRTTSLVALRVLEDRKEGEEAFIITLLALPSFFVTKEVTGSKEPPIDAGKETGYSTPSSVASRRRRRLEGSRWSLSLFSES
jgi:hypothetical protein